MSERFLDVAVAVAREAGALLRERFEQPLEISYKGAVDLVTEVDRAAEALIAERLRAAFPDHQLLGEEGARGDSAKTSSYRWLIDPLDGTTNFAHGVPHFAVSIGLEQHDLPLVGVVYDPLRDELFAAARGAGATRNGRPLRVSSTHELVRSLLATGFSYRLDRRAEQAEIWQALIDQVQAIRQTGSSALNLSYIAAGRLDGYWERWISPWDVSAGVMIVLEAGGSVSDYRGGPFRSELTEIVASNGILHGDLLTVIAEHLPSRSE